MALVTKNDVTQIFAIQAPAIDLPPTFANYPRGWDTARSNNGKPTIKQFNYIQQRTDQNVLWIHQNGAALPYDAAMEYAETAHVVKDGELQKKQGASWVIPYLGKSNNLDDVPDKATARNNLDVMSATEVNTAISNAIPPTSPDATETVAGKAKIATTAIAQAGTNDTDFITPLKLKNTVIGVGDLGWIDRTENRTLGINYTNDGKLRIVRVSGRASTTGMWITATIDGKTRIISSGSGISSEMLQAYAFIPSGKVYSININAGTLTNITWDEM